MLNIAINKSQTRTLINAIECFGDFTLNEVSADYEDMTEVEKEIEDINRVLDNLYQDLSSEFYPNLDLSIKQISCLLSALSVYKSVVENDVKTSRCQHRSTSEKDLAIRNILELRHYLLEILAELDQELEVSEFEVTPDTDWS